MVGSLVLNKCKIFKLSSIFWDKCETLIGVVSCDPKTKHNIHTHPSVQQNTYTLFFFFFFARNHVQCEKQYAATQKSSARPSPSLPYRPYAELLESIQVSQSRKQAALTIFPLRNCTRIVLIRAKEIGLVYIFSFVRGLLGLAEARWSFSVVVEVRLCTVRFPERDKQSLQRFSTVSMNSTDHAPETPTLKIKAFFESAPPLKDAAEIETKLKEFVNRNSSSGNGKANRVVCVTSGGTTVPLEKRCVRYIDNFSSGHRGSASTEYFLKAGYSVIFLYRRGTCQPFCRSLPDDPLLECFTSTDDSSIQVDPSHAEVVKRAITENRSAVNGGFLLKLPFTTIFEYLQILRIIAVSLRSLGPSAMFYLAAAVSDFYVPWESMTMHKIQSGSGPLDMRLAQVPKMLYVLRNEWAPVAFCISFKLETDTDILLGKADMALKKYKMHMVVANELQTRKEEVIVVTEQEKITVRRDTTQPGADVEDPLIKLVVDRHSAYIDA